MVSMVILRDKIPTFFRKTVNTDRRPSVGRLRADKRREQMRVRVGKGAGERHSRCI